VTALRKQTLGNSSHHKALSLHLNLVPNHCCFCTVLACSYGHYDTLKVLLEAGGNPLLLDCRGRTALDLARRPQTHPGGEDNDGPGMRGRVDKSRLVALLEQHMAK
jgi:hypothetical protein